MRSRCLRAILIAPLFALPLFALLLAAAPAPSMAGCQIFKLAELPVTMAGLQPLVPARINGADALFLADSGAFYSVITPASAEQYRLKLHRAPFNLRLEGVGGRAEASAAYVEELTLADQTVRHIEFLVGGSALGGDAVGLLGQNVLGMADAEYDLAKGVIRLMKPGEGCEKASLAYWAGSGPYSVIDIDRISAVRGRATSILSTAHLNGHKIHVMFDTGAATSFVARRAASRAGFAPDAPGVVTAGLSAGIGSQNFQTWIATFASFKVGDEEIHNARLRVGEADLSDADMLLGADFFLSHHVYVANSRDKLYFTYNGGPVFDLRRLPSNGGGADLSPGAPQEAQDEPTDAAGFGRRGAAYAARRDFERAISDLTRAIELDPKEVGYIRQRSLARWNNGQPDLALADLDEVLKLKPDDVDALVSRARLHLGAQHISAASVDLDAAARFAPNEANVRLEIADAYSLADLLAPAIAQYDLWIASHPEDAALAGAKNRRCRARALLGSDLDKALKDCNDAVRMIDKSPPFLDSRGLVLLRLGKYDKSIADYDASLALKPGNAWSLYGRGIDRLRKGMAAEGQADIAAAIAIRPTIADDAKKHGITP